MCELKILDLLDSADLNKTKKSNFLSATLDLRSKWRNLMIYKYLVALGIHFGYFPNINIEVYFDFWVGPV